jgi:polysaccharide biosynthesis/export protein
MNKLYISVLLIISTAIFSQELDEAYLESLPDSIRKDVLDNLDQRNEIDKPVYRRPSTMVKKRQENTGRFGDKIFNMMQSSFMPVNEPNFDSNYVLDFGDTLEIQLIGQKNSIEVLSIKRDGSINIPDIGKVFLSGLSLESANKLIKEMINITYIGVEAFITLVNIRDIQVLITGNAFNPGIYTLNGNSNLLHALSMAGGIDENGSYRKIDLIRNDQIISTIDLYDIFIYGKSGFGDRLRSGDTILISPAKKIVTISGAIKRPGLYELKADEKFSDLMQFAIGSSDNADMNKVRIERSDGEQIDFINVPDIKLIDSIAVQSSDRLNIGFYDRRLVTISGAINTPGTYTITDGETLYSLIQKAEGYKDNAYPFAAVLNNKKALELNKIAADKLYKAYIQKLITKGDALFASESLPFILSELKNTEVTGRVMAEFDLDVIKANKDLDTTLSDGDVIIIPIKTEQVYIFGEVNQPGAIRYNSAQSISQYISVAGGLLQTSDRNNIFVVHPNGEIEKFMTNNKLSLLNKNNFERALVYPGTVIYVPREVKSKDPSIVASIWAPIISSAATSITALSVLNNQ